MKSNRRACLLTFAGLLALAVCLPAIAQQPADLVSNEQAGPPAAQSAPAPDNDWHFAITPYIWFAGLHGTVGALGYDSSVHASFGDVFEYLNIGLMGAVEARKGRILLPVDFMWMKLSDDKGLPASPFPGVTSVKVKVYQSLLTPKVGYRLVDHEKLKVDGTFGIRYFHLGENLSLQPSGLLSNRSQSANWVDVVAGGRLTMPVSPKAAILVLGDAGAGGANLDYQVAGVLSYRVKPKIILQGGWRYLYVNYRPNSGVSFVYDMATSGVVLGATFNVK
ncbi:MAG: hypothetical protein WA419_22500 [Silvibacterium sp.]